MGEVVFADFTNRVREDNVYSFPRMHPSLLGETKPFDFDAEQWDGDGAA